MNATTRPPRPDVTPPAGFVALDDWSPGRIVSKGEKRSWRLIYADRTVTDHDATATVRATQYGDGNLDDVEIVVVGASGDDPLNSRQARELAAALLEAAGEMDTLTGTGSP
jgi:hypothetical protein